MLHRATEFSNPAVFLLQLNVTVEPGLPEGLTYNCSFSATGENFPLVVPAVELVAGTQYQCDITGSVTALDSVQQGSLALCFDEIDLLVLIHHKVRKCVFFMDSAKV